MCLCLFLYFTQYINTSGKGSQKCEVPVAVPLSNDRVDVLNIFDMVKENEVCGRAEDFIHAGR